MITSSNRRSFFCFLGRVRLRSSPPPKRIRVNWYSDNEELEQQHSPGQISIPHPGKCAVDGSVVVVAGLSWAAVPANK